MVGDIWHVMSKFKKIEEVSSQESRALCGFRTQAGGAGCLHGHTARHGVSEAEMDKECPLNGGIVTVACHEIS